MNNRVLGQAGNGAALPGAMGAVGIRDGGSLRIWPCEAHVHLWLSHLKCQTRRQRTSRGHRNPARRPTG